MPGSLEDVVVKMMGSERRNFCVLAFISLIVNVLLVNYLGVGYICSLLKRYAPVDFVVQLILPASLEPQLA